MLPSFTFGMGGTTGDGRISFQDHARINADIAKRIYEAAYAKAQRGEFPMGWQLENLRYAANNGANEAATGRSASFFTQPDFAPMWAEYNEGVNSLRAYGGDYDLEGALPWQLRGQNTGELMKPIHLSPAGSAFGGGDGGGDAWGTAMPYMGPATSNFQKGSSFAGGGYNPLLATHTPGATAFSTPWNPGGGRVVSGPGMAGMGSNAQGSGMRSYNSFGPWNSSQAGLNTTGNKGTNTTLRPNGEGGFSPYTRNQVNPYTDYFPYYNQTQPGSRGSMYQQPNWQQSPGMGFVQGGNVLPYQWATMPNVGLSSVNSDYGQHVQSRTSQVGNYASNAAGAGREWQGLMQDMYFGQPISVRAAAMSQNQGIFGRYGF